MPQFDLHRRSRQSSKSSNLDIKVKTIIYSCFHLLLGSSAILTFLSFFFRSILGHIFSTNFLDQWKFCQLFHTHALSEIDLNAILHKFNHLFVHVFPSWLFKIEYLWLLVSAFETVFRSSSDQKVQNDA